MSLPGQAAWLRIVPGRIVFLGGDDREIRGLNIGSTLFLFSAIRIKTVRKRMMCRAQTALKGHKMLSFPKKPVRRCENRASADENY
jgi:hypothetical protein